MARPHAQPVVGDDRETRIQHLVDTMRPQVEEVVRRMAERLVDLPEHEEFGAIEYELRDAGQEIARSLHQTGVTSRKKRGT